MDLTLSSPQWEIGKAKKQQDHVELSSVVQGIEQQSFPNIPSKALNLPKIRQQTLCQD